MSGLNKIGLSEDLHYKINNLVDSIVDKRFLYKIKQIAYDYGLKPDIKFEIVIVSSKEKYLFNYLSGAFGNKNLKKGSKDIYKFIETQRFLRLIKHLSGRAIYDKNIVKKVSSSLDYFVEIYGTSHEKDFITEIESLCNKLTKILNEDKGVIFIGYPPDDEIKPIIRILAHELFHLILIDNGFWFQGIRSKYDYLDEELANMLESEFTKNEKRKSTNLWFNALSPLKREERLIKITEVKKKLEIGTSKNKLFDF